MLWVVLASASTSRVGVQLLNSNSCHLVLGVVGYKPREFATQMNLDFGNRWCILRTIVDRIRALDAEEDVET